MNKKRLGLAAPPRGLVTRLEQARVFRPTELAELLKEFRSQWTLAEGYELSVLVNWLIERNKLRELPVESDIRERTLTRFVWGTASPHQIAMSLAPKGYLCHATAASIHGLLTYNPETIYVNQEQSPKPSSDSPLDQDGINRAFAKPQRTTRDIYRWGTTRIAVLSGKHSGRAGVEPYSHQDWSRALDVTGLERTLIDLTVRPDYAGGTAQVLEAFTRARQRVSMERLLELLKRLDYRYPYHQPIGFYMQRAGYGEDDLKQLGALRMDVDFYVGYGISECEFDTKWRVYYPKAL